MKKLSNLIDLKTLKFIIVGIANTLIGSLIMFTLYNVFHASYWFSSASNYVVGSIFSYMINKNWTFKNKAKSQKTVPLFILNIVLCYILAYGISKPLIGYFLRNAAINVQDNLSMGMGLVLFTGFNYLGQRYVVFKELKSGSNENH
ncbi:MAG: GtrA family protein [Clostridiaceae bacterium]